MSEDQANLHKLLSNGYTSCDERGLKGRSRRSVGPRKLDSESLISRVDSVAKKVKMFCLVLQFD